MDIARILVAISQIFVILTLAYYYLLLLASIPNRQALSNRKGGENNSFAILIPARNEAVVIGATIFNLRELDYPRELFDIYVVADHCVDKTADVAQQLGAISLSRNEGEQGRKGFALAWVFEYLKEQPRQYDAFVVLDADSRVSRKFLRFLDKAFSNGASVLQGQHITSYTGDSLTSQFDAIDWRLNNRLRNKAKNNLNLPCRLMGDAMCFRREVIEQFPWATNSLVEDVEYGTLLLLNGIHARYVPEAVSYGQGESSWQGIKAQRLRWVGGANNLKRILTKDVVLQGVRRHDLALLDRGLEMMLPGFSLLVALSVALLIISLIFPHVTLIGAVPGMAVVIAAWILIPLFGLLLDGAPTRLFMAYLYGPLFLIWRVWIGTIAIVRGKQIEWVRTERREDV